VLANSIYDSLSHAGLTVQDFINGFYQQNGLLVHHRALHTKLEEAFPNSPNNEKIAYSFTFDKLRDIYHGGGKKEVSLKELKVQLSKGFV
jgi:hypothetical protein